MTLLTTAAEISSVGWFACIGDKDRLTNELDDFTGVSCTPEKATWVLVAGSFRHCTALLETSDIDEPESRRTRATSLLPPGPFSRTWLVIMRMFSTAGVVVDESVGSNCWLSSWSGVSMHHGMMFTRASLASGNAPTICGTIKQL